jgi:two-component system, NarL family, response regulator NreC
MRTDGTGPGGNGRLGILLAIPSFPMLTAGFRSVIEAEPDLRVVGEGRGGSLLEQVERSAADIVITECVPLSRDGCTSFHAIETLRAVRPATRIIALDARTGSEQFSLALKAGADGFLTREAGPDDVVAAIRCVSRGQTYVSPAIVTRMVNTYVLRTGDTPAEDAYASLSDREREVLLLAAVGHTNREIAKQLGVPMSRVHHYRATVMEKLDLHDRVELLKFVLRRGVLAEADV